MADHAVALQGTDRVRAGIRKVISHYKQHFTEADHNERYKWEAIGWYKKHWDINASDFAAMLEVAFSKTANLLASGMYYPYRMIVAYAQTDPEEVRRIFKQLHNEELPLAQRYSAFRESCQRYIDKRKRNDPGREKALQHYQDLRAVMVYLTFEYPEKYYLFKSRMYTTFRDRVGFVEEKPKQKSIVWKVESYSRLCEIVLDEVKQDAELQAMSKARLNEDCYQDEALHLLAMDIVFYGSAYMAETEFATEQDSKPHAEITPLQEENNIEEQEVDKPMTDVRLNTILYGPPGTGKTYHTVIYAVAIIENRELASVEAESYSDVLARYNEYKAQGRIEFTTFHQSFGYEEFIEGIRPVVSGDDETSDAGDVQYSVQPGIFKRFCEKADDVSFDEAWAALVDAAVAGGDQYVFTRRAGTEIKATLRDEEAFIVQWNGKTQSKNVLRKDKVLEQWSDSEPNRRAHLTGGNRWLFDAIQAVIDTMVQRYRLPASKTEIQQKRNYVFIIDEINRGNISKIFGELITLIEESKRVGKPEGMTARLPNSQKPFGVPDNVYIIGTMNTADRSIATIDTALRRRFLFREMLPNPQVLADVMVEDLSISAMLNRMNQRIAVLYDREHTIGHAYFMKLRDNPTVETLAEIFRNNIIPLLQEYFYEDYEKIRLVLGDPLKNDPEEQFITACENDYAALFGSVDIGLDDSNTYEINDKAFGNIESYRSI